MRTGGRYFEKRSFEVKPGTGRKFQTILRLNGHTIKILLSKSKKSATAKGEKHLTNYYNF